MKSYSIHFSDTAKLDISNIWEYLFLYDDSVADTCISEIKNRISELKDFPFMGSIHEYSANNERCLLHKKYNIIYSVEEGKILILRIFHTSRDIKNYL